MIGIGAHVIFFKGRNLSQIPWEKLILLVPCWKSILIMRLFVWLTCFFFVFCFLRTNLFPPQSWVKLLPPGFLTYLLVLLFMSWFILVNRGLYHCLFHFTKPLLRTHFKWSMALSREQVKVENCLLEFIVYPSNSLPRAQWRKYCPLFIARETDTSRFCLKLEMAAFEPESDCKHPAC